MDYVLLLRAVNLGPTNKLAMSELKALLADLGHGEVKTFLNSGNATFTSSRRSVRQLATEVEEGLRKRLGLDVRACVRTVDDVRRALEELPPLDGYVVATVLFDEPTPEALQAVLARDWSPDTVVGNAQVLYIAYGPAGLHASKLTVARLEKLLGVGCTGRTPATLAKLL